MRKVSPQIAKIMTVTGVNKSVQILWPGCPDDDTQDASTGPTV